MTREFKCHVVDHDTFYSLYIGAHFKNGVVANVFCHTEHDGQDDFVVVTVHPAATAAIAFREVPPLLPAAVKMEL